MAVSETRKIVSDEHLPTWNWKGAREWYFQKYFDLEVHHAEQNWPNNTAADAHDHPVTKDHNHYADTVVSDDLLTKQAVTMLMFSRF